MFFGGKNSNVGLLTDALLMKLETHLGLLNVLDVWTMLTLPGQIHYASLVSLGARCKCMSYPKINTEPSSSLVYESGDKLTAMHQC